MKVETKRILLILFIFPLFCISQNYGNIWYFAHKAGIDFNGCTPIALTNGADTSGAGEGSSTICNNLGQLLFYTNSDKVWDRNHNVMPNGNLLNSFGTLSQVLIVPKPLSSSIYYIITTEVQGGVSPVTTMQYHIVDMTLNSGLGDVSSKNNLLNSNPTTEQVAATFHNNGNDIWIMTHEYGNNKFLAYLLTSSGLTTVPIVSNVGPSHVACTSNFNARGEIKFSPDGSKIAFNGNGVGTNNATNILTLFDFNNNTGIVSNPLNLPFGRGDFGLSFSPDNSKLYGCTWKTFSFSMSDYDNIYQFDLSSGTPSIIAASKIVLDSVPLGSSNISYGDIKIGPDGKIYVARHNSGFLSVINSPNSPGLSCNHVSNGFYLGGKTCWYGLNNYIEYTNYCSGTGINENNPIQSIVNIYPNPSKNIVNISTDKNNFPNLKLEIINSLGQTVLQTEFKNQIDVSNLANGFYTLLLKDESGSVVTKKFVKE